jgi:hypothetical protein
VAPFLRALAWALVACGGFLLALLPIAYATSVRFEVVVTIFVSGTLAAVVGAGVRGIAMSARPSPVTIPTAQPKA